MKRLIIYIVWFNPHDIFDEEYYKVDIQKLENKLRYCLEQFIRAVKAVLKEDFEVDIYLISGGSEQDVMPAVNKISSVLTKRKLNKNFKTTFLNYGQNKVDESKTKRINLSEFLQENCFDSVFVSGDGSVEKIAKTTNEYVKNHSKNAIFYQYMFENQGIKIDKVDKPYGVSSTISSIRKVYKDQSKIVSAEVMVSDIYNFSFNQLKDEKPNNFFVYLNDVSSFSLSCSSGELPISLSKSVQKLKEIITALKAAKQINDIKTKS